LPDQEQSLPTPRTGCAKQPLRGLASRPPRRHPAAADAPLPCPAPDADPALPGIVWGLILPLLLPAAGLLLVAGLGGLAALRRKRKALAPLAVA